MHFSVETLQQLLQTWGYLAVFVFVAVESTGIPFPGETMLVTAAAYAGAGHLNIELVIACSCLGAIVGDNLGYVAGRTGGRDLVLRFGKYLWLDAGKLDLAEEFFARHGDKTVFLGRFLALLRTWAAFLAGLNRMPWRRFLFFNAAGGIVWSISFGVLAFTLGKNLPLLHRILSILGFGGFAVVAVVVIALYLLYRRKKRRSRASLEHPETGRNRKDPTVA